MAAFYVVQRKPVEWITKTTEAAGRGVEDLPDFICKPQNHVRTRLRKWLSENRIAQPAKDSIVVVSRRYADNGTYGVVPELAAQLPALASTCMAVKGLMARAKRERVVQDEVEKANRRPTDPTDTTRHPSLLL